MFEGIEDKFIVINKKRFDEINENTGFGVGNERNNNVLITNFLSSLEDLNKAYYLITRKEMNQKYIVINQDEPYAEEVWDIIKRNDEMIDDVIITLQDLIIKGFCTHDLNIFIKLYSEQVSVKKPDLIYKLKEERWQVTGFIQHIEKHYPNKGETK